MTVPSATGRGRVVLFVPTLTLGGAERHAVLLRNRLSERGYDTILIAHGRLWSQSLLDLPGSEDPVRLDLKGMSDPFGWLKLWRLFFKIRPDAIIAVNQGPLIVSVVLRFLQATRARVLCVFHTTYLLEKERGRFFLFRWALRYAHAFVCVSTHQQRFWTARKLRARRVLTIPNGVDLSAFEPDLAARVRVRSDHGFREGDLVLGVVATFRAEKNHGQILDALTMLIAQGLSAKAILVGDGPTRRSIEDRALDLGIAPHVVFAGEQTNVKPWIAACDIGVLCSIAETFPLSALEFLAMGVPMVMPDLGGTSEIVTEGVNGALFEAGRTEELVAKLTELADPAARLRLEAHARSSAKRFSVEAMVDGYDRLLDEVLAA